MAPEPADFSESLDALRFALKPEPSRLARWRAALAQLLRHPRRALAIAAARLTGKRLRARQSLAALIGIDHRLALPADSLPAPEPASALAANGIGQVAVGASTGLDGRAPIVLLAAPGQTLVAGAAAAVAAAFRDDAALQALYGDALFERIPGGPLLPVLRPAFDPDYLRGVDFAGPVVALRRSCLDAVGADLVSGAEALDLLLRIDARFGVGAVRHLPRILTVWRPAADGVPHRQSRLAAVRRDLERRGEGTAEVRLEDGVIAIARPLPEPCPLVSLIVPTRDRLDLLRPCIESLIGCTDWPEKEILICDNDSRAPETLAYFRDLARRGAARIVACPGPFNFAAMNNAAAAQARGRLLAFVNNDVEAFRPDWLRRMAREALRPNVGAVGAKLLDGEGRIQHGGEILGTGGLVTHAHRHFPGDASGYLSALAATHQMSAVTAACLVIEADKFRRADGFDATAFAVDFNDVDLCLRLNAMGLGTLLVPSAVLHHREASSRRWTPGAQARHREEIARFRTRWGPLLAQDPHYHPAFDPDLSTHARLRAGRLGRSAPGKPR